MRIDLYGRTPETADADRPNKSGSRTSRAGSGEHAAGQDEADISFDHSRLSKLEAQANQVPEIRAERVQALARSLRDGTYQAKPDETAEAMLSDVQARSAIFR
jgi:flagellar biosynthesis anti-sigma factor FlgM